MNRRNPLSPNIRKIRPSRMRAISAAIFMGSPADHAMAEMCFSSSMSWGDVLGQCPGTMSRRGILELLHLRGFRGGALFGVRPGKLPIQCVAHRRPEKDGDELASEKNGDAARMGRCGRQVSSKPAEAHIRYRGDADTHSGHEREVHKPTNQAHNLVLPIG